MGERLPAGAILCERFELLGVLGQGGFGITYKALDTASDQLVAIKEYFLDSRSRRRDDGSVEPYDGEEEVFTKYQDAFREEAQALSGFDHPNIVEVYEHFDERGTSYFVMAFIEGPTLEQKIREDGALATEAAMLIAERLISAVRQIHVQNRLHRDIKPGNILLSNGGEGIETRLPDIPPTILASYGSPVLLDFGASREVAETGQTVTGIHTPHYGAPEQSVARGRQDVRTDIYGLGATLYACLAGEHPPSSTDREVEDLMVPASQRFAKRAPPGFLRAIDRALQLRPAYRPRTVTDFRDELFGDLGIAGWSRPPSEFSAPGPGIYSGVGVGSSARPPSSEPWARLSSRHIFAGILTVFLLAGLVFAARFVVAPESGPTVAQSGANALNLNASVDFLIRQLYASQSIYNEMSSHKISRDEFARTPGLENMAEQAEQRIAELNKRSEIDQKEVRAIFDDLIRFAHARPEEFTNSMLALEEKAKGEGRLDNVRKLSRIRKIVEKSDQEKGVSDADFELMWSEEVEILQ